MGSPVRLYQDEMYSNMGLFATWLPNDPVEVGDVGVLKEGRFTRLTSLAELNIQYRTRPAHATASLQYTSTESTKVTASAGAAVAPVAKAEIRIDFSRDGAFLFHAAGLK